TNGGGDEDVVRCYIIDVADANVGYGCAEACPDGAFCAGGDGEAVGVGDDGFEDAAACAREEDDAVAAGKDLDAGKATGEGGEVAGDVGPSAMAGFVGAVAVGEPDVAVVNGDGAFPVVAVDDDVADAGGAGDGGALGGEVVVANPNP